MSIFTLIPLCPLITAVVLVLGGRLWGEQGHRLGIPAMGLSFGLSVWAFWEVLSNGPISVPLYQLFQVGSLSIDLNLYIDQLTVLLLLLVTGVSSVVHVFSSRYMIGDPRYNRFFAVIALFTFSMLMLVMSGNLLMLYVFWEVMGLCSYLLISHWAQRKPAIQAATKAFIINAIADVGLGFGIILTVATFGTLDIQTILSQAESLKDDTINVLGWLGLEYQIHPITIIPFFLFMGAMGKSAQLPFHVWLPFAMEAPTPVSALIHAATMVNAGPFLLVRLSPLIILSPEAMAFIAIVGGTTALFAAMVAMVQSDIKKNLAYSTISQIGFMIMSCGIGAFVAAIFHLLAHGFLKAFLFLSTGNALQAVHRTHHGKTSHSSHSPPPASLYVGALVLACLPPFVIFSGPYERLWMANSFPAARLVFWGIGLATVFFTAIYLFRGIMLLFQHRITIHDGVKGDSVTVQPRLCSPTFIVMVVVGSAITASMLMVFWSWFVIFLAPALTVFPAVELGMTPADGSVWSMLLPAGAALCGWIYAMSQRAAVGQMDVKERVWKKALYVLFLHKGYFDELYECYFVQPTLRFAHWLWQIVDIRGIDRAVHLIGSFSILVAHWLWRVVDIKGIDRIVVGLGGSSVGIGRWLWRVVDIRWLENNVGQIFKGADAAGHILQETEPRTIQHHILVMVFWLVSAIGLLYVLV
ncbi:MAG: NADH-quinone oxidoreductase subunit L [Nitrospirales bacterium]